MRPKAIFLLLSAAFPSVLLANPTVERNYLGFSLTLDCKEHAASMFKYTTRPDSGNYDSTAQTIVLDPNTPYECQPNSISDFKTNPPAPIYVKGSLVTPNHIDYSELAVRQARYMTNILPMTKELDEGAWVQTEKIIECNRDTTEMLVLGGAIWGNAKPDKKNDYFVGTHNIRTPEKFWKVIIARDGSTIAWLIPNTRKATAAKLDSYIITPLKLEKTIKMKLSDVPLKWKSIKPKTSWKIPDNCQFD